MPAEKDIDKVVQQAFFQDGGGGRVLVEVGAARPDYLSVSASFRDRDWTVVSIEPNPYFCAMHRALGHEVLQYACSDRDRDNVDFFVVNSHDAEYLGGNVSFESFSSLGIQGKFAEDLQTTEVKTQIDTIQVNVRTLDTILAQHHPEITHIDLLAVDVEGWELHVLRGLDLDRFQPEVVILENLHKSWSYRRFMLARGYTRWGRLKPNEIYRRNLRLTPLTRTLRRLVPSLRHTGPGLKAPTREP